MNENVIQTIEKNNGMVFPIGVKLALSEIAKEIKSKPYDEFKKFLEDNTSNTSVNNTDNTLHLKYPLIKTLLEFFHHKTSRYPKLLKQLAIYIFLSCSLKAYE